MSRYPENFSFAHINRENDQETVELENKFENAESISAKEIKEYAQHISDVILKKNKLSEQKILLIDLLNNTTIARMSANKVMADESEMEKVNPPKEISTDKNSEIVAKTKDVNEMAKFSSKEIKKKIIEELKKYISKELYFFIKNHVDNKPGHMNHKAVITDSDFKESFIKETDTSYTESKKELQKNIELLASAFKKLPNPELQMPYVIQPEIVQNTNAMKVGYTVRKKEIVTLDEIFSKENVGVNFTTKEILSAFADCIRGAKFLTDNGLSLTDINTYDPGKNLGIDKTTKKGILFDLDGLQKIGHETPFLMGPFGPAEKVKNLFPPEYRKLIEKREKIIITFKAMIWEFGSTLIRFATLQKNELEKTSNYRTDKIMGWRKIIKLANKMTSDFQLLRPGFDSCINELTGIINEYFKED